MITTTTTQLRFQVASRTSQQDASTGGWIATICCVTQPSKVSSKVTTAAKPLGASSWWGNKTSAARQGPRPREAPNQAFVWCCILPRGIGKLLIGGGPQLDWFRANAYLASPSPLANLSTWVSLSLSLPLFCELSIRSNQRRAKWGRNHEKKREIWVAFGVLEYRLMVTDVK